MANRYWVGGTGTWNTTSTTNWSASSGGASGASVPTAADSVFLDQAGTYTVTMTGALACLDITVSAGTVTFATGTTPTLSVAGSMTLLAGTVWNSTGTITFTSTTTGRTVTTNGVTLNGSVTFNGTGGGWTLVSALTLDAARTITLTAGALNLDTYTLTTGRFNYGSTTARTLAFGTGLIALIGTGAVWSGSSSSGLSVTGNRVIYVNYNGASPISVAASSQSFNFYFTAGTYGLTLASGIFRDLNFTGFAGTVSNTAISTSGNLNLGSTATFTAGTSTWSFVATSVSRTITTNGKTMDFPVTFNGVGGTWALQDALTMGSTRLLTHTNGTIDLNGKTLTVGSSYTTATGTKNLTFNGGTLVCPAVTTTAFNNAVPTGFTTTAGTGTGTISMTGATAKTFVGGGSTFNCTINQGGAGTLTISGGNTFNNITNTVQPATIRFPGAVTTTFNNFNLKGTAGNLISIENAGPGTQATISKSSGTVSSDYLNITDSAATGGATWNAGANSVDGGNNTGWTFGGASSQSLLPSLFVNVNIFHSASVTQTAPQQALLPGIYTNTNTFYLTSVTQTSSQQTLLPSLYVNTNTFYSANVSAAYLLAPAIYVNANAFYAPVVTAGPVLIAPALYGNTNTFYAATASASYTVSPDLLANTNIFYNPRVAQLQKLFPALVEPNNLFYAASVSAGPVNISPLLIANQNTFYSSKVFWWDTQPVASSDWDDFPISSKTWTELSVTEETWDVV